MARSIPFDIPFQSDAYQSYLSGLKSLWGGELYRAVLADAEPKRANDPLALELAMQKEPSYQLYAWLERRHKQMQYHGRWGFVTVLKDQQDKLNATLAAADAEAPERLRLKPGFAVPDYVQDSDTHQLPGGTWRELYHAYVLAWSGLGPSFTGASRDGLVDWYAARLAVRCADLGLAPRRILDLGCQAGRSTRALKRAFPAAEAIGIDVSEPVLRDGHLQSLEAGAEITLCLGMAEELDFPDASADLIASHWLYHEMPPGAVKQSMAEAARVLRPGGLFCFYDMYLTPGGVVGDWLHAGYAARNNEPFAYSLSELDAEAELKRLGFADVRMDLTSPDHPGPEIPETLPQRRLHYMTMVTAVRA